MATQTNYERLFDSFPRYRYKDVNSLDEFKYLVTNATLIFAVNSNPRKTGGSSAIVFGLETCNAIVQKAIPPQRLAPLVFELDFATNAVEHLLAALLVVKGYASWNGEIITSYANRDG